MRFKVLPEDFQVEELLGPPPQGQGNYALWRVEKRDLTTLEAQTLLAAKLGLPPRAVSFPALKDKRAVAVQYATTPHAKGLPQRVGTARLRAERVGSWPAPLSPRDLAGNRFTVVLRDLAPAEAEDVRAGFALLAQQGFPNYFDLQRFGSFSARLGFPGKLLLRGDWEGALRAYLAEPLLGDPPSVRRFKALARERWGDWKFLKEAAPRGNLRSVLTFLCDHPRDFKRAVNLITPRVLSLWLSAYQSFLWNRGASRALEELVGGGPALAPLRFPWGALAVPRYPLDPALQRRLLGMSLPLPAAKGMRAAEEDLGSRALWAALAEEGLTPRDLKARGLERAYLSGGVRALWAMPGEPKSADPEPDELFPGRLKLTLSFLLPPGAYATLLLRLLAEPWGARTSFYAGQKEDAKSVNAFEL